jgi:hypothetical protein
MNKSGLCARWSCELLDHRQCLAYNEHKGAAGGGR